MNPGDTELAERQIRERAKAALRKQMRAVRDALPSSACDVRSRKISKTVLALDAYAEATMVLAFASIRNEVRTRAIIDAAMSVGKRVALPRVTKDKLALHAVGPTTELSLGAFAIPEPAADEPYVDPSEVNIALVPALAVDARGYRIGYGGGFYDKLIPGLKNARTCALAYDFQLVAEVPELPFDARVDFVVTDARVIRTEV